MFSVAPNIVLAPNMTQNAERRTQTQNTEHKHCSYPASLKRISPLGEKTILDWKYQQLNLKCYYTHVGQWN